MIMESLSLEDKNITKNIRNLFKLKRELNYPAIKDRESYIDFLDWIKSKKAAMNPNNRRGNICFQYAVTVVLNHEEIKKYPQIMTKIKPIINKCYWERICFFSEKDDWKDLQKNNVTIALNVLYEKYILLMFENITQIMKASYSFNNFKREAKSE